MKMNFKGLVSLHTLPKTTPLLPLYEAVINSIQSIEDAHITNGKIEIVIEREKQMNLFEQWETDVENIVINDNGIGFNDDNYNSFDTYASEFKIQKGCKGVGRMMWLKAFCEVSVESIFDEMDQKKCRKFLFDTNNAVHDMCVEEVNSDVPRITQVRLMGLRGQYKSNCPKKIDTIARNILNHCFTYYVLGKAPKIIVCDEFDTVDVDELYRENIGDNTKIVDVDIKGIPFKIVHSKNYMKTKEKHTVNLCANHWVVQPISLSKIFGNVNTKLEDNKGEFTYSGYVMSELLDSHVNRERTKIELPEQPNLVESIGSNEIVECMESMVLDYLRKDITESNKKKAEIVKDYVYNKNPKYRLLLKNRPELLNEIPWITDEEKLEMELFKQEQKFKLELKREGKELEQELKEGVTDYQSYIQKRNTYAEKVSDMGKSNLAEYVMHRKAILDILAQNIKYKDQEQQKYAYEKNIHQLIFPMTKTSDDIDYLQHNLWIIDEKLAYHHYLASDMKLKSMSEINNNSGKEPDIVIFDSPFAFTDEQDQPYRNITIIEFKRPGREHYTDAENPVRQVKEYMDDIVEGKVKTKDGEFLSGTENIRFFCYILCDVDLSIKKLAKLEDLKPTPDNMGFYKYIDSYKAYLEIIPYNKLIQDSQKRNKILFDKLFNQV